MCLSLRLAVSTKHSVGGFWDRWVDDFAGFLVLHTRDCFRGLLFPQVSWNAYFSENASETWNSVTLPYMCIMCCGNDCMFLP